MSQMTSSTVAVDPSAKQQSLRPPPTKDQFLAQLHGSLSGSAEPEYRIVVGMQCWELMNWVWDRRMKAARGRSRANFFRYTSAVISGVAAAAGGSLAAHLQGRPATVFGVITLVLGLLGTGIAATRPSEAFGIDLAKAAEFERLYWDICGYTITTLATDAREQIAAKLDGFAASVESIGKTAGGGTTS